MTVKKGVVRRRRRRIDLDFEDFSMGDYKGVKSCSSGDFSTVSPQCVSRVLEDPKITEESKNVFDLTLLGRIVIAERTALEMQQEDGDERKSGVSDRDCIKSEKCKHSRIVMGTFGIIMRLLFCEMQRYCQEQSCKWHYCILDSFCVI